MNLDWTKREFEEYVLLHGAHCNYIEAHEEIKYILSKVNEVTFNKMHTEIVVESEHQNIEKIQQYLTEKNTFLKIEKN